MCPLQILVVNPELVYICSKSNISVMSTMLRLTDLSCGSIHSGGLILFQNYFKFRWRYYEDPLGCTSWLWHYATWQYLERAELRLEQCNACWSELFSSVRWYDSSKWSKGSCWKHNYMKCKQDMCKGFSVDLNCSLRYFQPQYGILCGEDKFSEFLHKSIWKTLYHSFSVLSCPADHILATALESTALHHV